MRVPAKVFAVTSSALVFGVPVAAACSPQDYLSSEEWQALSPAQRAEATGHSHDAAGAPADAAPVAPATADAAPVAPVTAPTPAEQPTDTAVPVDDAAPQRATEPANTVVAAPVQSAPRTAGKPVSDRRATPVRRTETRTPESSPAQSPAKPRLAERETTQPRTQRRTESRPERRFTLSSDSRQVEVRRRAAHSPAAVRPVAVVNAPAAVKASQDAAPETAVAPARRSRAASAADGQRRAVRKHQSAARQDKVANAPRDGAARRPTAEAAPSAPAAIAEPSEGNAHLVALIVALFVAATAATIAIGWGRREGGASGAADEVVPTAPIDEAEAELQEMISEERARALATGKAPLHGSDD